MYIVNLNYHQPLEHVDALLKEHGLWLDENFKAGNFIAAGRKQPRTGGVILVKNMPLSELQAILAQDPFQSIAHYEVINVEFSRLGEDFENLKGI